MTGFQDYKISWAGVDYQIRAQRVLGAIARCEAHITMLELAACIQRQRFPYHQLSSAYHAVLAYAGAKVSHEDVYTWMNETPDTLDNVIMCLNDLLELMIPPATRAKVQAQAEAAKGGTGPENPMPLPIPATRAAKSSSRSSKR